MYITGGFAEDSVSIKYALTGSTLPLSYVSGGDITIAGDTYRLYQAPRTGIAGDVIRSVTCDTQEYLLGRKDYEKIYLNVNNAGALSLRGSSPSLIGSYAEFRLVVATGTYKQDADIDLLGNDSYLASGGAVTWTPLLSGGFDGTFDGNRHTIANLKVVASAGNAGLFGLNNRPDEMTKGTLNDIHITSGSVENTGSGADDHAGSIAGENQGIISNCSNGADITGNSYTGGITGKNTNDGDILYSYNTGTIIGTGTYTGGITGYHDSPAYIGSLIAYSYNAGTITGSHYTGGIAGYAYEAIYGCYNIGTVTGGSSPYQGTGGIVGYRATSTSYVSIIDCYNTGAVSGNPGAPYVGGIIGNCQNTYKIIACYNTGAVSGSGNNTGGIVGGCADNFTGQINACYNTGAVSGSGSNTGGIVGGCGNTSTGQINACYNTGAVSGGSNTGGVAGNKGSATINACYWKNNTNPIPSWGIGNPAGNDNATPFSSVFLPTGHIEWGTGRWDGSPIGDDEGIWWKAGTTSGGTLPRLWFE
jgi:hypothetical protein